MTKSKEIGKTFDPIETIDMSDFDTIRGTLMVFAKSGLSRQEKLDIAGVIIFANLEASRIPEGTRGRLENEFGQEVRRHEIARHRARPGPKK